MSFRDELVEAMAQAQLTRDSMADGFDADTLPWEAAGEHLKGIYLESATVALDAALSYRQTVNCETCGGTGTYPELVDDREMPCGCDDGRVRSESPRLAIVEQVGRAVLTEGVTAFTRRADEKFTAEYEASAVPVYVLAPDLPAEES